MKNYNVIKMAFVEGYSVTNGGDIIGKRGGKLSPCITKSGYKVVHLQVRGRSWPLVVHQIVWVWFNKTNIANINHIDGNKLNNAPCNLEESDKYRQMQHAYKNNLMRDMRGDSVGLNKISRDVVSKIRSRSKKEMGKDLAKEFGISKAQVSRIINRVCWNNI